MVSGFKKVDLMQQWKQQWRKTQEMKVVVDDLSVSSDVCLLDKKSPPRDAQLKENNFSNLRGKLFSALLKENFFPCKYFPYLIKSQTAENVENVFWKTFCIQTNTP